MLSVFKIRTASGCVSEIEWFMVYPSRVSSVLLGTLLAEISRKGKLSLNLRFRIYSIMSAGDMAKKKVFFFILI